MGARDIYECASSVTPRPRTLHLSCAGAIFQLSTTSRRFNSRRRAAREGDSRGRGKEPAPAKRVIERRRGAPGREKRVIERAPARARGSESDAAARGSRAPVGEPARRRAIARGVMSWLPARRQVANDGRVELSSAARKCRAQMTALCVAEPLAARPQCLVSGFLATRKQNHGWRRASFPPKGGAILTIHHPHARGAR